MTIKASCPSPALWLYHQRPVCQPPDARITSSRTLCRAGWGGGADNSTTDGIGGFYPKEAKWDEQGTKSEMSHACGNWRSCSMWMMWWKSRDPPLLSSSAYISSLFFYFPRHSFSAPLLDKWKATTYSSAKCMAAGAELFASALLHTWQPRWFDSCQASAWSAADICEIWPTAKSSADGPAATQRSVMLDMSL